MDTFENFDFDSDASDMFEDFELGQEDCNVEQQCDAIDPQLIDDAEKPLPVLDGQFDMFVPDYIQQSQNIFDGIEDMLFDDNANYNHKEEESNLPLDNPNSSVHLGGAWSVDAQSEPDFGTLEWLLQQRDDQNRLAQDSNTTFDTNKQKGTVDDDEWSTGRRYFASTDYYTQEIDAVDDTILGVNKRDDLLQKIDNNQNLHSVVLYRNSGVGGTGLVKVAHGDTMPKALAPHKDGAIFLGFFDKLDGGKQYYDRFMTPMVLWDKDKNDLLYAQWLYV